MRGALALMMMLVSTGCLGAAVDVPPDDAKGPAAPGSGLKLDALSKPSFAELPEFVEYVTMTVDGIRLYTAVSLPDGPGPFPTILILSPYNNLDRTTDPLGGIESAFRAFYVPRGYAIVLADVRGTGNSEGCMDMMGAKEQQDGHDIVEWIAAQPWSTGKVGMYGISYVGTTPGAAAITAPPHLTTIVPIAGVTNQWRNTYQNGVPYSGRHYALTYEVLVGAPPPSDVARGPAWALNAAQGGCDQEEAIAHTSPGTYEKGVYDDYWAERNLTRGAKNIQASVFYVQGFTDRAVNPMEAIYWFNEIEAPKKAWMGQWAHQFPPRDDWENTLLAWFDHWLKGADTGIMDTPQVEVITNLDTIRLDTAWPPEATRALALALSEGALGTEASEGAQTYEYNGAAPRNALVVPGTPRLPDGLVFTADALDAPVHMAGIPLMHLRGSVDAPNTYWLCEIWDIGDGEATFVTEGWFNAHLHEGFDKSSPLEPGKEYDFFFKFEPREYIFEEGHQIELRVRGSSAAVFPFDEPRTMNTVHFGPQGSWLELPILDAPAVFERPDEI